MKEILDSCIRTECCRLAEGTKISLEIREVPFRPGLMFGVVELAIGLKSMRFDTAPFEATKLRLFEDGVTFSAWQKSERSTSYLTCFFDDVLLQHERRSMLNLVIEKPDPDEQEMRFLFRIGDLELDGRNFTKRQRLSGEMFPPETFFEFQSEHETVPSK